nr:MAG TPA: Protein of unknown function (DUF1244) [Crassvirales sp.]
MLTFSLCLLVGFCYNCRGVCIRYPFFYLSYEKNT